MLRHSVAGNDQGDPPPKDGDNSGDGLLAIEDRLRDDADGSYRASLLDRLARCRTDIRRVLDNGVPPEEYRRLNRVLDACSAAVAVLESPSTR